MNTVHPARPAVQRDRCRSCGVMFDLPRFDPAARCCEDCDAAITIRAKVEELIAGKDAKLIRRAADEIESILSDAFVFRSARDRARMERSEALRAVRTVRHPGDPDTLGGPDRGEEEDFAGRTAALAALAW